MLGEQNNKKILRITNVPEKVELSEEKRIRILHAVTSLDRGGLETMLMNLYRKIDREKVQFDFLVHKRTENGFEQEVLSMGGRIFNAPERSLAAMPRYIKKLEAFFREHNEYRLVHSHINTFSVFVLMAAKKAGVPIRIAHSHTAKTESGYKRFFKNLCKLFMNRYCTFRFACSEEAGRYLFGRKMLEDGEVTVLKNGIDCAAFAFDKAERNKMRKKLSITEDELVLCHVGRFDKYKNQSFVVEILDSLRSKEVKAKALLIGNGEDFEKVKTLCKEKSLLNNVIFTGVVPNVSDYLQAADVFVFPSVFEGLPLTLVEAQANGLRCFTSTAVSTESDVSGNVSFLPLEDGAEKWAQAISAAMPFERKDCIEKIREHGYDSYQSADMLQKFYLEKWC